MGRANASPHYWWLLRERRYLFQRPNVIGDLRFHRGSHAQRLMDAPEVVVHEVKGDRAFKVLDFLGEPIGQSREAAHAHPHR